MAILILTTGNHELGGSGNVKPNTPYCYYDDNINEKVFGQTDADSKKGLHYINIRVMKPITFPNETEEYEEVTVPANTEVTVLFAKNKAGAPLLGTGNTVALPCPPYCNKDLVIK